MNEIVKFLSQIRSKGIELALDGDKIRCKAPSGALTPEIRAELAFKKEDLILFFKTLSTGLGKNGTVEGNTTVTLRKEETVQRFFPLTSLQKRKLIREELGLDPQIMTLAYASVSERLDIARLEGILNNLVSKTLFLLVSISLDSKKIPSQTISLNHCPLLDVLDLTSLPLKDGVEAFKTHIQKMHTQSKPRENSTAKFMLYVFPNESSVFLIASHRLIADPSSLLKLTRMVLTNYRQNDNFFDTTPDFNSIDDFFARQSQVISLKNASASFAWWSNNIPKKGFLRCSESQLKRDNAFDIGSRRFFDFSTMTGFRLEDNSQRFNYSFALFILFIFKITRKPDLLIGFHDEEKRSEIEFFGDLESLSWVRLAVDENQPFSLFLESIKTQIALQSDHNPIEFGVLMESLTFSCSLLNQLKYGFYYKKVETVVEIEQGRFGFYSDPLPATDTDFAVVMYDQSAQPVWRIIYNPFLITAEAIEKLGDFFKDIFSTVFNNHMCLIKDLKHFPDDLPYFQSHDNNKEYELIPADLPDEDVYARANSEMENFILGLWKDILNIERIGINQNFFSLGGDIFKFYCFFKLLPFGLKHELSFLDLLSYQTIHDLAFFFESNQEEMAVSSKSIDHRENVRAFLKIIDQQQSHLNIAIIGMAGRFPGADNIETFWNNIKDGAFSLTQFTKEELLETGNDISLINDPQYVAIRGVIRNTKEFDADFFEFTPREAQVMDPQHRLFLELAWEALESAGYSPLKTKLSIGTYAGVSYSEYFTEHLIPNSTLWDQIGSMPIVIGNSVDNFSTKIAYRLGLTGPTVTVQAGCSTGLAVVHLACQAIKSEDCQMAIAGGVNLSGLTVSGYLYEEGMTFPPDGRCRAFDEKGMGSTVSQGAAIVVLKDLKKAIEDGDRVYAIIKGSAINNDGMRKSSYTSYSFEGQKDVISIALKSSNINPETISYIESSSTGSKLGDPIEVQALTCAFQEITGKRGYCALGALKPNIGGLDVAAGTASLIKAALCIYNKKIPPLINFQKLNPAISLEETPFYITTQLQDWDSGTLRRAAVNAFGLGGTNAHVIIEEAPRFEQAPHSRSCQIINLSAKTTSALEKMTQNFVGYLHKNRTVNFADICYTLHVGRKDFKHRRVLIAKNMNEAINELTNKTSDKTYTAIHKVGFRPIAFMFPGQGAQYLNMGKQLFREERVYRQEVERCWTIVHKHFPDVYKQINPSEVKGSILKVDRTVITQPLIFITEYALAQQLMFWGIKPQAMIGNSLGEFVAACLSGVFTLEDCIIAIVSRGILMQEMPNGSQLAVNLPESQVLTLLNHKLSLAGTPTPNMCIVSGDKDSILDLKHVLESQNILAYRLHTSKAFHSYMMDPIVPKFIEKLKNIKLSTPTIPFISNVTGTWITDEQATSASYWANQLRETVRFSQGLEVLYQDPHRILLEVGPEKLLSAAAIAHPAKTREHRVLATMRQPQEEESDLHHLLNTLGRLWLAGVDIDWDAYHCDKRRFRIPLPTYPFERVKHWIEKPKKSDFIQYLEPDELQFNVDPEDTHYRPNVSTEFVPPKTDDEIFIAKIWCQYLGLTEIGVHDDFFELGGNSLIAVRLANILSLHFNMPIASHMFLKRRTISALNHYIIQSKTSVHENDSPLVEINRGSSRSQPLFLVHPVGGEVFFYRELAQSLGLEQAVYGIQAPSIIGKSEPFSDICTQANYYVEELLKFKPRGPYLLGGASYGGVVAFEMAQQMANRGFSVPLVIMVDSPGPGSIPEKLTDFAEILDYLLGDQLNINIQELRDLDPEEQLAFVYEEARFANRMDLLPASLGIPMFKTWMAHQEAMHKYKPVPYNGRVLYFRPTTQAKGNLMNMHLSWIDLIKGGLELYQIPGNHITMNELPNVAVLADQLKNSIKNLSNQKR